MTTLLTVFVPGTPRPKGSMRHVGQGRMVEQLQGSGDWRAAVAYGARQELAEMERLGNPPGVYLGSVDVYIRLQFNPPKSWNGYDRPSSRATGDVDKHARNILDALQDAGVFKDDAQAVTLSVRKWYCKGHQAPGAHITVTQAVD